MIRSSIGHVLIPFYMLICRSKRRRIFPISFLNVANISLLSHPGSNLQAISRPYIYSIHYREIPPFRHNFSFQRGHLSPYSCTYPYTFIMEHIHKMIVAYPNCPSCCLSRVYPFPFLFIDNRYTSRIVKSCYPLPLHRLHPIQLLKHPVEHFEINRSLHILQGYRCPVPTHCNLCQPLELISRLPMSLFACHTMPDLSLDHPASQI